ncbi:hypothetical protein WK17_07430 [Burkholderia multivorans]|nr:hypothetical protein WK17_07430 [Burkholderia multivorans]
MRARCTFGPHVGSAAQHAQSAQHAGCVALDATRHAACSSAASIQSSALRRGPLRRIVGARTVADGTACGAQQIMLRRQPKTVDRAVRAPRIATTGILAMLK